MQTSSKRLIQTIGAAVALGFGGIGIRRLSRP